MIVYEKTVKISSKGQITLPKAVREKLLSEFVHLIIEDDNVRLEPVVDVQGSLKHYAAQYIPYEEAREIAWSEVGHDQAARG